jgi:hypothetical protein
LVSKCMVNWLLCSTLQLNWLYLSWINLINFLGRQNCFISQQLLHTFNWLEPNAFWPFKWPSSVVKNVFFIYMGLFYIIKMIYQIIKNKNM